MTTESPPPDIDVVEDDLLKDPQTARLLGVSPASVSRYRLKGKRGVRLPWTWQGRNRVTTRAAIDWFNVQVQRAAQDIEPGRRPRRRELDPETEAACEAAGI